DPLFRRRDRHDFVAAAGGDVRNVVRLDTWTCFDRRHVHPARIAGRRRAILSSVGRREEMNFAGPLSRAVALAGLTMLSLSAPVPALAARADVDLIKSYIGTWKGASQLKG